MGKKLVIVESPAKAKTINKILGKDFKVCASKGHIRDLPEKELGVDIEKQFKPKYGVMKGKATVIKELKEAAKDVEAIYLAPDPDREGEAIAWHLQQVLKCKVPVDQIFRVTYNEITAQAIRDAFENIHQIDMDMVDAQQARRVLDRIVGYKVSPLLWKRVPGGSSAGRVQSVALRLVCEREREILAFNQEKYWLIGADFKKLMEPQDVFTTRLMRINGEKALIRSLEAGEKAVAELEQSSFQVKALNERVISKRARPPYITSTLQQAASSMFGFPPSRTMSVAQKLYEGSSYGVGLITYMRTDSVNISKEAMAACREFVVEAYGDEYMPAKPNYYKSRQSAQEAHEAIRPTDVTRTPEVMARDGKLKPEELKLYRLIWQRFVASQMAPARICQRSADIESDAQDGKALYTFRASASEILFPGYMRASGIENTAPGASEDDADDAPVVADRLPPLTEKESLACVSLDKQEKETKPPPRYSEASLIRTLEENGVGRPSTFAAIVSTIQQRKYITKEKRTLCPTESGLKVNDFLVEFLPDLFDVHFTAKMEALLDDVEQGRVKWTGMMGDFYKQFEVWIENAKGPKANPENVKKLLELMDQVTEWKPAQKRGRRTYDDSKYAASVREQIAKGEKEVTQRQRDALMKLIYTYREQITGIEEVLTDIELLPKYVELQAGNQPPREETMAKIVALIDHVTFVEPRKVGKRVYDDAKFAKSLQQQVEGGKRLSDRQLDYLHKLLLKYADQLGGEEAVVEKFGIVTEEKDGTPSADLNPLFALMEQVTTWNEPVQRGKRTWDDKSFFDSLHSQYQQKKSLSDKQVSSLKKMIGRYAAQIPDYAQAAESFGLKMPSTKSKKE